MSVTFSGMTIDEFSPEALRAIRWYVYALMDPLEKELSPAHPSRIFYVGKGRGNRCFQHARAELKRLEDTIDADPKNDRIRQIREITGQAPPIRIIAHALEEHQAFALEAALIAVLSPAGNLVSGHGASVLNLPAESVNARLTDPLTVDALDARVLLVNLNGGGRLPGFDQISDGDLAGRVLGDWPISSDIARNVDYIAGVFRGLIRVVFRVNKDAGVSTFATIPRAAPRKRNRQRFVGVLADDKQHWLERQIVNEAGEPLTTFPPQQSVRYIE